MLNRKIEENSTKDIRIDEGLHRLAKVKASDLSLSIKEYVEGLLVKDLEDETVQSIQRIQDSRKNVRKKN